MGFFRHTKPPSFVPLEVFLEGVPSYSFSGVDSYACNMHDTCMATKTISLKVEAWERLKRARRYPEESFSEVVMRAHWPGETVTGAELLSRLLDEGPFLTEDELLLVEDLRVADAPPEDKWREG